MEQRKKKVIVYVDGFNFYYGLKSKGWRKYYWLDMVKFAEKLLRPHQELVEICYFSAKPTDPQKSKRQDAFFQANSVKTLVDRDLYEACLLPETIMLPDGFALRRPDKWR